MLTFQREACNSQISVGEIVIVKEVATPATWSVKTIRIVQEIMKGQDCPKRAAVLKIASRDRQHSILKGPEDAEPY